MIFTSHLEPPVVPEWEEIVVEEQELVEEEWEYVEEEWVKE